MERSWMINSVSPFTSYLSCSVSVTSDKPNKRIRQQEGSYMNLTSLITDNITEILVKIIEFTHTRQKIIIRNITCMNNPGFVPHKLAVKEFSGLLNSAIDEHIQNQRLLLRDTENIKFGASGDFEVKPTIDSHSKLLLEMNRDEYLEVQIKKLLENSLNQRVAAELLRKKQNTASTDY
jgi:flagellar basal body rod protein FlgB